MTEWMPLWWDGLTFIRLVGLLVFVVAWFVTALLLSPWFLRKLDDATVGYVDWMVEMFDRMFIQIDRRWCSLSIAVSVFGSIALGVWLTSALPYEPVGYHFIRFLVVLLLVVGPFGLPVGYRLPRFIVNQMWTRRVDKFTEQLLDGLAFMSNGLKSGLSLVQAMSMVSEELDNPISEELALVLSEQRVGVPFEEALLNLESRIDTEDLQILVTSITILRQSGGNLSETFDTIAYTIRERTKVQGKIRSLTAQGISQAIVICAMPFGLAAVLYLFDEQLISRLWTTWLGWVLLFAIFALQTVGALLMKRFVTIRV
jgi:tight adherence protein B